jgi:hypothetical protein
MPVASVQHHRLGSMLAKVVTFTGDSSYPAGGYSFPPSLVGLTTIQLVVPEPAVGSAGEVYIVRFDHATKKLRWYYPAGGSSGGTNDGSGTGSIPSGATGVTSNAAQPTVQVNSAPAREVQTGKNLTGASVRLLVLGV